MSGNDTAVLHRDETVLCGVPVLVCWVSTIETKKVLFPLKVVRISVAESKPLVGLHHPFFFGGGWGGGGKGRHPNVYARDVYAVC